MNILKKIIYVFIGFLFVLILIVSILLKYYEKEIYTYILEQINKNINTEISFQKTKLSLFQYFPNAAVTFYKVKIDINKSSSLVKIDTIDIHNCISSDEITIKINLLQLLKSPLIISGIEIKNGSILLLEDKFGYKNYQLKKNLSKNSNNLIFQVQKLTLKNINFKYLNERSNLYINTYIKSLNISGLLHNSNTNFKVRASVSYISILSYGSKFIWKLYTDISFYFASKTEIISLTDGELFFNHEKLRFKGYFFLKNSKKFDFAIQSQSLKFENLNKLNIHILKEIIISDGQFSLFMNLYCRNKINSIINLYALAQIKNLSFKYKLYKLRNIDCKLSINATYDNNLKTSINFSSIKGNLYNSFFNIPTLKYNSLNDSLLANGSINFKCIDINNFINDTLINFSSGEIYSSFILNTRINKNFNLLKMFEKSHVLITGINCSFLKNSYHVSNLNGKLVTSQDILYLTHLYTTINNNNISFEGYIPNYQIFFLDSFKKLEINGELKSKLLNINNFISNKNRNNNHNSLEFKNPAIQVKININVDKILFNNFIVNNYQSSLLFSQKSFALSNISANFCDGRITKGTINATVNPNLIILASTCDFKEINIEKFFKTFNDFGQKEITSNNIKGQLNGKVNYKIVWKNNNFLKKNFQGYIDFEVINGELNGFRPIYRLSKFIELSELNNIKFKEISNKILITNNIVHIPVMNLNNSALNLSLSGTHSLENKYEYHFKVILSNLLIKKLSSSKRQKFDTFLTEEDTLRMIYIKLQGDSNSYKFSYDSKIALKAFSDKIKNEKNQFKKILNEEFGIFNRDSTLKHDQFKSENKAIIESEDIKPIKNKFKNDKKSKMDKVKSKIEWKDD
jgi:hypothetical protein